MSSCNWCGETPRFRQVANTLAELIIGGALVSIDIGSAAAGAMHASADDRVTRQQSSDDPAA
jgi:hypothetical protein